MTSRTQVADAMIAIKSQMYSYTPIVETSDDKTICVMNAVQADGKYDVDDMGLRRSRTGTVAGAKMTAQVASYCGCTVIHFYAIETNHSRRFLIDAQGQIWMDADGRAVRVGANNKYLPVINKIMQARAN